MTTHERWIKAVTGGLTLCLLCSLLGVYGQAQGVRERVVRLHILANSDSTADQTLKLQVRDAVVKAAAAWDLRPDNAEKYLPRLRRVAEQTVQETGHSLPVTVRWVPTYFTTRQYGTTTLPAGMYNAVQITLGEGKGQNWWCVVYPPLCVGAAVDRTQVLTDGQEAFVSGDTYQIRFKVVEWIESFLQLFRKKS